MTKCIPILSGLLGLAALCGSPAAFAQSPPPTATPVAPSDIDRTQFPDTARALGMGGADLIVGSDVSAAAANPASIADAGGYSVSSTVVGTTSNVHVDKINDLSNGLKKLNDQINNNTGSTSLAPVRDAFQKVYNFATDAGANDSNSTPASLSAALRPLTGVSFKNVGVVAYGTLAAKIALTPTAIPVNGLSAPTGRLNVGYGVVGLTNIAVPFSIHTAFGTVGIAPRYVEATYAGAGFLADETNTGNGFDANGVPNGSITGATYREVHQSKFDADIGFTSIADPVYHVRGAIVVRNLLSPSFHLPRVINSQLGSLGAASTDSFDFSEKPQIDLGAMSSYNGVTYAAEVHNLGNANGGNHTYHLGVEYMIGRAIALRGGYNDNRFVAGIGFSFGGVRLDLATGANPQEQVAIGLTIGGK